LNAFLLYLTLKAQSKFNEQATQNSVKEAFISRYYELLHAHNEIVNQIKIETVEGRQVFKILYDEFHNIFEHVEKYLTEISERDATSLTEGSEDKKIYEFLNSNAPFPNV